MNNEVEEVEDEEIDSLLDSNKTGAPANYITKSVNVELAAGRYIRFISPEGEETLVLRGKADRFRKAKGVGPLWTVS